MKLKYLDQQVSGKGSLGDFSIQLIVLEVLMKDSTKTKKVTTQEKKKWDIMR